MEEVMSYTMAGLVGFALSAACGMRIFAPLTLLSIAVHFGWLQPGGELAWIGSFPAMSCFAIACVIEMLGFMIPWIDHLLDVAATPVAAIAGTLVMVTQLASHAGMDTSLVPPWMTWSIAAVVGGGVATGVHAAAGTLRVGSTAVSGGLLNPLFAILETISSFLLAGLAILLPIVAVFVAIIVVIGLAVAALAVTKLRRRKAAGSTPAASAAPATS